MRFDLNIVVFVRWFLNWNGQALTQVTFPYAGFSSSGNMKLNASNPDDVVYDDYYLPPGE